MPPFRIVDHVLGANANWVENLSLFFPDEFPCVYFPLKFEANRRTLLLRLDSGCPKTLNLITLQPLLRLQTQFSQLTTICAVQSIESVEEKPYCSINSSLRLLCRLLTNSFITQNYS